MKKAMTFAFVTTILGFATGLQGASSRGANVAELAGEGSLGDRKVSAQVVQKGTEKVKVIKEQIATEKSVPAPSPVLLMGVAAGVVLGLRKLWPNRRAE
jgi:hypothetical protein